MTVNLGMDQADQSLVAEVSQRSSLFTELGVSGLRRSGGYVDEEFLPQLKGRKAVQVYREMADNEPIVGAMLFAMTQLLKNSHWNVTPGGKGREDTDAAKLLETCRDDMSVSWGSFVGEALSHLIYGWAWHEPRYKRRVGPWEKESRKRSKHTDNLIGWHSIPGRSQDTLQRWVFNDSGNVTAMIQQGPPDYQQRVLPLERSLLFRFGQSTSNPEGRSALRNAYRPYFLKKRLEEFEAVGVERDLAGMPMVKVPAEWLKAKPGTDEYKQVQQFKKMVRSVRRNEQEGMVFPIAYDTDTRQPLFEFELLGGGGGRQFQTDPLIKRYEERMLMTVLADFILVGHQKSGTYNMHVDKTGIFRTALNSTLRDLADVVNRHAVPRLFLANGWRPERLPYFEVEDVDAPDVSQLASFLSSTANLGFTWGPDAEMDRYLRKAAGLPAKAEDDFVKERRYARQAESTRFVQGQTAYLSARSELAQLMAQQQQVADGETPPEQAQQLNAAQAESASTQQSQQREQEQHEDQMQTSALQRKAQQRALQSGGQR